MACMVEPSALVVNRMVSLPWELGSSGPVTLFTRRTWSVLLAVVTGVADSLWLGVAAARLLGLSTALGVIDSLPGLQPIRQLNAAKPKKQPAFLKRALIKSRSLKSPALYRLEFDNYITFNGFFWSIGLCLTID